MTLGSSQGNELYASEVNGSGDVTINNWLIGESSLSLAANGSMVLTGLNRSPSIAVNGAVTLQGGAARLNADTVSMGTLGAGNGIAGTNVFTSTDGSAINTTGNLAIGVIRVGQSYGTLTGTTVTTGGIS